MYNSTLRFQTFLRLVYGQFFAQTRVSGQVLSNLFPHLWVKNVIIVGKKCNISSTTYVCNYLN